MTNSISATSINNDITLFDVVLTIDPQVNSKTIIIFKGQSVSLSTAIDAEPKLLGA